jgi:toxin ParE1/3/4
MAHYELTEAADDDFDSLFEYGIDNIDGGYRRAVFRAHSIYYRVESTHIVIVRILGRQDPAKAFTWLA